MMVHIEKLGERCDDLQSQIKEIEKERDAVREKYVVKAKESLLSSQDFNFEGQSAAATSVAELQAEEGTVPSLGKFESSQARYLPNLKTERF